MDHPAERLDVLYAEIERTTREIAVLQAEQVHLLAEYNALFAASPFCDFVTDEIALALHSTLNAANKRLTLATTLVTRLPGTLAAMEAGDLDLPRAEAIAEVTRPLSDELAGEVEDQVLAGAVQQNPNQVRRAAAKAVLRLDPQGAEQRHARRREDRYVEILPAAEGMADLYALLPAEDAMRIKVRLDAYAKAQPKSDPRTMDQRRTDAMTDLLLDRNVGPITTTVRVTMPATLLATATQAVLTSPHEGARPSGKPRSTSRTSHPRHPRATAATPAPIPAATVVSAGEGSRSEPYPAELAGYGVITSSQAVTLAAHDATWRRLLTDPATGDLTEVSRHQYAPPAALADHVRARDQRCVFPGCSVAAEKCDLDHRVPYPRGATSAENLAALCRHHHRLKHRAGWTLTRRLDGAHVWTSPQERDYLNPTIPLTPPDPPPPPPPPPPAPLVAVGDDPPPF